MQRPKIEISGIYRAQTSARCSSTPSANVRLPIENLLIPGLSVQAVGLIGAPLIRRADSNRVFELRVYHAVPGKLQALESRFRDTASKLLSKHDLKAVGYWIPEDAPASDNTFIYILAHPSREEAKENWDAMRSDPEFQEMAKSEQADKLVEKVDATYMHPTDFSPTK